MLKLPLYLEKYFEVLLYTIFIKRKASKQPAEYTSHTQISCQLPLVTAPRRLNINFYIIF